MNLEERLRERIRSEGPISFYEWMKAALYDEREGYYCGDRARQGRAGDYRTAPETSPLFAATFATYFAKLYRELGSPPRFTIVEFGAGSGEFAYQVLTTLQSGYSQVFNATNYVIEEISDYSREHCKVRLTEFSDRVIIKSPTGTESSFAEPATSARKTITGVIFSNELVDASPVNRVVMNRGQLSQLYIGLKESDFVWVERELEDPVAEYCRRIGLNLADGQIFEVNLDAERFISKVADSLDRGYLITVDYGAERNQLLNSPDRWQGTLRAFRRHEFAANILASPGEQDLTTTIDWTQVKAAGELAGLRVTRFEQLDEFLVAEGILELISDRAKSITEMAEAARLTAGARELILPTGMAASFQVLVQQKVN